MTKKKTWIRPELTILTSANSTETVLKASGWGSSASSPGTDYSELPPDES